MGPECDVCGIRAGDDQIFAREAVPFCRTKTYCPNCYARFYRRVLQFVLVLTVVLGLLGATVLWRDPTSSTGRLFLNALFFQAFIIATILPHEFGHAFMARLVGFQVSRIVVGFGRVLFECKLFGFQVSFRRIPYGGITVAHVTRTEWVRTRYLLFVLAGPMANAALAAIAFSVYGVRLTSLTLESPTDWPSLFILANLIVVLENLFPFVYPSPYGRLPSDGLALFQIVILRKLPFIPPPKPAKRLQMKRRLDRVIRCIGACLWFFGALLFAGIVIFLVAIMKPPPPLGPLVAGVILFGSITAVCIWFGVRVLREPVSVLSPGVQPSMPHADILRAFYEEVRAKSTWPIGDPPQPAMPDFESL